MNTNRCPEWVSLDIIEQEDIYGKTRKICKKCMCVNIGIFNMGRESTWKDAKEGFKGLVLNPLKSIYNKGVDIEITNTNTGLKSYIDEKAQSHYINKSLPTFAFELSYLKNNSLREGWLFDNHKITQQYFIITCIQEVENQIKSCRLISIDRDRLITLLIEKTKAQIKINSPAKVLVQANNFHLTHVITNLIENGIKYSVDQPLIEIILKEQQGEVFLTIKDQGIGMDAHQIKKAFDNFYRAQTGNIHDTKGFGLGLSYSKLVVEKMGGSISLESKKNIGTTVTIKLQRA